ncbi:PREDICTED: nifU-like protein 4, mitochondrial [Tarenaya hassleriana]|uniref:nifU-like protein 4, mitochondrial n=1 Tax=Tarenaya hassleriana TaxID=28532 RepID=UPI00053C738E|nr:PREDICTED: nifU-like protein 4, mitochondrial [Tarenaya hassleriana]XP_010544183.1 PREDICTED: nifU-like protein 4, mitochondrial [Tarenaya hassleriana]
MRGIVRLLSSVSRCGAREIVCRGSTSYSSLVSRRLLFISVTNSWDHQTTNTAPIFSRSCYLSGKWNCLGEGQRRTMFIQTQSTPNPSSLMFHPGKPVMEVGSADFPNARSAMGSPLAKTIFAIDGVVRVFYGSDFVTVTKSDDVPWDVLKPEIFAAIMDFYSSGQPLFLDAEVAAAKDTAIHEDDSETVAMIKELLETRIRPAVQDDGGDIEYCGFDPETGIVKLRMQGACSGCPSSSVTLKSGIENMLMHYVSEVKGVEQEVDEEAGTGQMEQ